MTKPTVLMGQGLSKPRTRRRNPPTHPNAALAQLRAIQAHSEHFFTEQQYYVMEQMVKAIEVAKPRVVGIGGRGTDEKVVGQPPLVPNELLLQFDAATTTLPLATVAVLCDLGADCGLGDDHSLHFLWQGK